MISLQLGRMQTLVSRYFVKPKLNTGNSLHPHLLLFQHQGHSDSLLSVRSDRGFVTNSQCAARVAAHRDEHTRACAMQCSAAGFVIITPGKKTLKLDPSGNAALRGELKASQKKDRLRADVTGEVEGDRLKVQSIKLL
jgi:hypothetical protein